MALCWKAFPEIELIEIQREDAEGGHLPFKRVIRNDGNEWLSRRRHVLVESVAIEGPADYSSRLLAPRMQFRASLS